MKTIIGLRELREHMEVYEKKIQQGHSFIVLKRSRPIFKISPVDTDEQWEAVIDFTKIKKGGVDIRDVLSRL
jgi:antitoxin (DNA-binding transcriptional repressor) of toxin-antitoxin stability system